MAVDIATERNWLIMDINELMADMTVKELESLKGFVAMIHIAREYNPVNNSIGR